MPFIIANIEALVTEKLTDMHFMSGKYLINTLIVHTVILTNTR